MNGAPQSNILRLQRAENTRSDQFQRPRKERNGAEVKLHIDARRLGHFDQMAEETEAGNVGTCVSATRIENIRALFVRLHHARQGGGDPRTLGLVSHIGGEQRAGADGLGQNDFVACLHAAFAENTVLVDEPVDGETERHFRAFTGMAAHQRGAGFFQNLHCARH